MVQISRISTIAYNLTTWATVRRYRRRFATESSTTKRAGDCDIGVAVLAPWNLQPAYDSIAIWENEISVKKKNHCYPSFPAKRTPPFAVAPSFHTTSFPKTIWTTLPEEGIVFLYISAHPGFLPTRNTISLPLLNRITLKIRGYVLVRAYPILTTFSVSIAAVIPIAAIIITF